VAASDEVVIENVIGLGRGIEVLLLGKKGTGRGIGKEIGTETEGDIGGRKDDGRNSSGGLGILMKAT